MAEASEVKSEKVERRQDIVVEATSVDDAPALVEPTPEDQMPHMMAGPPTEVTLNGISNFLAEHHTYLAQNTMAMIAAMRAEMAEDCERRLTAQEQAHAWTLAENQATIAEQQRQLAIAQHSLERMIGDREGASWTNAIRFRNGKQALTKKAIFHAWFKEAFTSKADRLLTHVATKIHERNLTQRVLSAWIRFVWGSKENRQAKAAQSQLKAVTSEIIARYEAELEKHRSYIDKLKHDIIDGKRQRSVLKDELRRTLLKGMVTMNMEALTIFNQDELPLDSSPFDSRSPPPPLDTNFIEPRSIAPTPFLESDRQPRPRGPP